MEMPFSTILKTLSIVTKTYKAAIKTLIIEIANIKPKFAVKAYLRLGTKIEIKLTNKVETTNPNKATNIKRLNLSDIFIIFVDIRIEAPKKYDNVIVKAKAA